MERLGRYKIHNLGAFWNTAIMPQGKRDITEAISERKWTEMLTVWGLMAIYFSIYALVVWIERFRMPYLFHDNISLYWEVIKANPFSEVGRQYIGLLYNALAPLHIFQWLFFSLAPVVSFCFFLIGRSMLKKMPMHEAAEDGKLSVLGQVLQLFIQTKWTLLSLFTIGYAFFATSSFINWVVDLSLGNASFNMFDMFFPVASFFLAWLFIRLFLHST
ncbi:hypothetical protein [Vibrio toranzoniae]|uniref:hypothetical protein n=1 Tax=Vibrio toranzoniae TaxID=1194427 RepID=UPI001377BA06|nr:hypothetical protein [Vibrio toranzoniae]NAZ95214.1 hypothetical protein [Vibrio toranzoniae]